MKIDQTKIKEILLQGSYIGVEDVKKAQAFVEKNQGDFLDYFINQGLLTGRYPFFRHSVSQ